MTLKAFSNMDLYKRKNPHKLQGGDTWSIDVKSSVLYYSDNKMHLLRFILIIAKVQGNIVNNVYITEFSSAFIYIIAKEGIGICLGQNTRDDKYRMLYYFDNQICKIYDLCTEKTH